MFLHGGVDASNKSVHPTLWLIGIIVGFLGTLGTAIYLCYTSIVERQGVIGGDIFSIFSTEKQSNALVETTENRLTILDKYTNNDR